MMRTPMTKNERHHFPLNALLQDYRVHCEQTHGATFDDYRRRVSEWHKENFPECVTVPRLGDNR